MPGYLIQQGATVTCVHGGQALLSVPNPQVTVAGMATALVPGSWTIAGCPGVPPNVPPCTSAAWTTGTIRVTSFGQPLVISTGTSTCIPAGTPLVPGVIQPFVTAI